MKLWVVGAPFLETFKVKLNGAVGNLTYFKMRLVIGGELN